ncbi:hypothetical protein [Siphonobacter sp. SORGH_AS_0500]|nr:hypothetical protein [Siphonobacter sp. SORGH_AS_0500]MDR6195271.1 hypothetical protein [Siphonobacter sp. SORGH_AS_0500]
MTRSLPAHAASKKAGSGSPKVSPTRGSTYFFVASSVARPAFSLAA